MRATSKTRHNDLPHGSVLFTDMVKKQLLQANQWFKPLSTPAPSAENIPTKGRLGDKSGMAQVAQPPNPRQTKK
jgi:hypothetical protein